MSRVVGVDVDEASISNRYSYASLVMSQIMQQNLEIGEIEFPKGVLEETVRAFDMAVGAIGHVGDIEKNAYYLFFAKAIR